MWVRERKDPEPSGEVLRSRAKRKRSRLDMPARHTWLGLGEGSIARAEEKKTVIKRKNVYPGKRGLERLGGLGSV